LPKGGKEIKMKIGTMDELAVRENHEIEQLLGSLQEKIRIGKRNKADTARLEEDFCYVQREYDIRVARARWIEKRS
jgi:hypothetical protein